MTDHQSSGSILSPSALRDLRSILKWTREQFGERAAERYRELLLQAIQDVAEDPELAGSRARPELVQHGVRTYHLYFSRTRVSGAVVKDPRHFILYRRGADRDVEIARILHDSRDLARHLPGDSMR